MQKVVFRDLGRMAYQEAWDYQEALLQENLRVKAAAREVTGWEETVREGTGWGETTREGTGETTHHLLFVEHPPVYTLGKSGHVENVLIGDDRMREKGVQFFRTNRGGDITFHGPGQLVGYPILDLEKFYTDIGLYLRNLEEVTIRVLAGYGIRGDRSPGETGVWIEPGVKGRERKICAIGVRCSRWVTMHGFRIECRHRFVLVWGYYSLRHSTQTGHIAGKGIGGAAGGHGWGEVGLAAGVWGGVRVRGGDGGGVNGVRLRRVRSGLEGRVRGALV